MTYRFYITIGSSQIEVHPLNFLKTSLVDAQESGEIFYRRKFNGTLRFIGDDFELLYLVETVDSCTELILTIEQKNSGHSTYHDYWEGYFSTPDGFFDLDNCYFEITPKPYDLYKNFKINGDVQYNILDVVPIITTSTLLVSYTRNRYLIDVIEHIISQIEPTATVTSWFFNNEYNPVTLDINKYRYLTIAQKSDIKRPTDSNPATKALMSFNELMEILRTMYNVYYKYDGTTFRIEHLSYWDDEPGLDLRTQISAVRSNKYSYERMPRFESFSFMEARDSNYTKHTISYDEKCVGGETINTTDYNLNVTTDIDYIEDRVAADDTESDIADSGFVILANYLQDVTPHVYFGTAYENAGSSYNYPNSWSYLLRAFFLHGRVLLTGNINDTAVDFISTAKNKKQDIKAIVCYEDNYDPSDYITTELGEDWFGGQKASVKQATIYPDGRVDFMLLYGEETNDDAEMPAQPKIIHCTITDSPGIGYIYTTLSEPNIYDTYYWIFYDPWDITATCQEIMIAAGDTYQVDLRDDAGAYKFNTSDDSLVGWTFILNDNEVADQSIHPVQCGATLPPAIPAVPVLNPPSQAAVCGPIHVDWSTSAGATYYQVWRNPNHLFAAVWEVQANPTVSEYYDYEAGETNMTFSYKITACNISGCSAESNEESITHPVC